MKKPVLIAVPVLLTLAIAMTMYAEWDDSLTALAYCRRSSTNTHADALAASYGLQRGELSTTASVWGELRDFDATDFNGSFAMVSSHKVGAWEAAAADASASVGGWKPGVEQNADNRVWKNVAHGI
jgi:hypothetical protein